MVKVVATAIGLVMLGIAVFVYLVAHFPPPKRRPHSPSIQVPHNEPRESTLRTYYVRVDQNAAV